MLGFLVFCAAAFTVTPAVAETFEACERRGLELASIHSQSEEDAIELVLGNSNNRAFTVLAAKFLKTPTEDTFSGGVLENFKEICRGSGSGPAHTITKEQIHSEFPKNSSNNSPDIKKIFQELCPSIADEPDVFSK
ncbi:hypothetical protein HUJ04_006385 [Dendroctonus ponderosae]|nr:hypothetical protein HUJ04_006385 [Dendroctonus ponderosae]